ncbi:asparagine synthase-related protein [Caulobacter sp. CCH5-E12]|uniref:asparagine synthase-related protein n=1 Tax=Caulobacter sp. CCH5-E12 TaxID=1768770 RepID=UPI00078297D5|nr:asparagine synthase-related protein [Caulobacter sp. CCH5-E12]
MRDYLVIEAAGPDDEAARLALRDRLVASGQWRAVAERRRLCVLLEAGAAPDYRHLPGVAGALIGDVFDKAAAWRGEGAPFRVQALAGRSPREAAQILITQAFGRYLAIFTDGEETSVLRDPMGIVEAVAWRREGLRFIGSRLPADRAVWPLDLAIDWLSLAKIFRQKNLASHLSSLVGVSSIEPGVLTKPWADEPGERLWAPVWFARGRDPRARDPAALARVIDGVVAAYALGRERILCEISGGLDSAIIAASLKTCGAVIETGINHTWPQREADERPYAEAVAALVGAPLVIVERGLLRLDAEKLSRAAGGARPNFVGGDPDHDFDLATRLAGETPGALFTGRGGDAIFYQMPTLELARDLLAPARCGAPRLRGLVRLAQRRGTTVWRLIASAWAKRGAPLEPMPGSNLFSARVAQSAPQWHPWLEDLVGVSPAKRVQLRALVNSLSSFRESYRHTVGDILDPLLAQPVVELCLATPAAMLALGPADRPFARRAFVDRLPPKVATRHGKGDVSVFFARSLAVSLDFLRPYLMEGRLAQEGLLSAEALDPVLSPDYLIWTMATPDVFVALALESWVRRWEARLVPTDSLTPVMA